MARALTSPELTQDDMRTYNTDTSCSRGCKSRTRWRLPHLLASGICLVNCVMDLSPSSGSEKSLQQLLTPVVSSLTGVACDVKAPWLPGALLEEKVVPEYNFRLYLFIYFSKELKDYPESSESLCLTHFLGSWSHF